VTDERTWAAPETDGSTLQPAQSTGALRVVGNGIGNTQLRQSAGTSVIGRAGSGTGNVADITAAANDRLLARVTGALSWVQITLGMIPDALITGAKLVANTVGNAQFRQSAGVSVVGRSANSAGDVGDIAAGANDRVLSRISNALSFAQLTAGMFPAGVVATAALADDSVDDTKAGNRVPQFYRRQGGDATQWGTVSGVGSTDYTPTAVRMQAGFRALTIPSGSDIVTVEVTYPEAFSAAPLIFTSSFAQLVHDGRVVIVNAYNKTATPASVATISIHLLGGNAVADYTAGIYWLAIGPE